MKGKFAPSSNSLLQFTIQQHGRSGGWAAAVRFDANADSRQVGDGDGGRDGNSRPGGSITV